MKAWYQGSFVLSQELFWVFKVFCVYIQILELLILILWKCHWYFDRNESMNCLREYGLFNNFNSSSQWVQYISPLDCVILSFLYHCLIVSWVQVFLLTSPWLGLFLSISLFLMQLNGVVFLNSLSKSLMFLWRKIQHNRFLYVNFVYCNFTTLFRDVCRISYK